MKAKNILICLLASMLLLSLCACSSPAASPGAAEMITDMVGREVPITPGAYQRIVCIGAGALRMYCSVGDVSLLCGVEDIDNTILAERPRMFDSVARPYVTAYEQALQALPSCGTGGPNAQAAEAERILSCKPDLVISAYEDSNKADALQRQLGVPVLTLSVGGDGVFDAAFGASLRMLGKVLGQEARADALLSFVQREADAISARTADVPEADKPLVYICGLGNWGTTDHRMTAQNYAPFRIAHVENVVSGLSAPGVQSIEAEKFIELGKDMDVMILDAAAVKNIAPLYRADPAMFDTCKAWQTGEVYLQMAYNAYYTNYETALLNTWFIAKSVYPDRFTDIDMTEKTNEITKFFYSRELADEIFAYPTSFGGYQKLDTAAFFADGQ